MNSLFEQLLTLRRMEYVTLDQHLHIVTVSAGGQRFADNAVELTKGMDCYLPFPELVGAEAALMAVLQGQQASFELHAIAHPRPNGSLLYFDLCVTRVTEAAFAESALIIFFEDVTKHMALEQCLVQASNEMSLLLQALTASKEYLNKIVTSIADALIVTNQTGIIKTVNQATQALLGYGQAALIGQSIATFVADNNFLLQAIQPDTSPEEACKEIEIVCHTSSGAKRLIAFSCSTIQTDSDDGQAFIYIGRDITDRERTQQRLMAQYTIARLLSEAATIAQATTKILPTLCHVLEWDLVELWLAEEDQATDATTPLKVQRCIEAWSKSSLPLQEFMAIAQKTTLAMGIGLPGRVWATGQPQWLTTADAPGALQSPLAAKAGLRAACGFPVQSSGEVLGVVTFFSRELKEPAQDLLQTMTVIGSQLGQFIQRKRTEAALSKEQEQTERLLLNVLPKPIAERLKQSQETIAENFAEATVLFADLVNFTQIAASLSPIELVNLLNQIFSTFDRLSEHYNLEKIKTIGDAYMVVGGVPQQRADHAQAIAAMALDMQTELAQFNTINGRTLTMRIGIHSGPVIAGVIGIKKFIYDLWGDTVNIASRMESQGVAGQIQVTASTYARLQDHYAFKPRGCVPIKGKGRMHTYFLLGRKVGVTV